MILPSSLKSGKWLNSSLLEIPIDTDYSIFLFNNSNMCFSFIELALISCISRRNWDIAAHSWFRKIRFYQGKMHFWKLVIYKFNASNNRRHLDSEKKATTPMWKPDSCTVYNAHHVPNAFNHKQIRRGHVQVVEFMFTWPPSLIRFFVIECENLAKRWEN